MQQNSNRESVSGATTRRSLQQNLDTLRECKDTWEQAKKLLEASSMPKNVPVPQENVKQPINRDELVTKTRLTALKNRVQKRANEWENISSKISESLALNRD